MGPAALAMRAAVTGSPLVAVIVIMFDVVETSAETDTGALGCSPRLSRNGSMTDGALRTSTYVARSLAPIA